MCYMQYKESLYNANQVETKEEASSTGIQPPLFGWDLEKPETLSKVGAGGATVFEPKMKEEEREEAWRGWKRAVERSMGWDEAPDET